MSYSFYKDAKDGDTVTLTNGVRYQYQQDKKRWMVHSLHEAEGCPRFDAVATKLKDLKNPSEQIVIEWYAYGQQAGQQGFSEISLVNFLGKIDGKKGWISIDGNKYMIYRESTLGDDPVYELLSQYGDLTHYVGKTVEVHACEDDE